MEHIQIAALRPNLDSLESKQIKAVVTLIWPYSSSQRQFALLLAEPEFRLRRKNGQVRVRFSSTSARALATTGVGIGDEVVLGLHGAQFVKDGAVSTPGKSLEWELQYTQTVAISVRRNGAEIENLELIDAAPTPAPQSPIRKQPAAPIPISQWSSPAFLKHTRLSDGPIFEQPAYDPLADESNEGHDKKRRRKSYRDWKAWTCTARTPSPEKENVGMGNKLEIAASSPSRPPPPLPQTPIPPTQSKPISVVIEPAEDSEFIEESTVADSAEGDTTVDDGELQKVAVPLSTSPKRPGQDPVRNAEYYDLYAGPNEVPSVDSQYDFGGDTELNTDEEGDSGLEVRREPTNITERVTEVGDDTVPGVEDDGGSTTELATEVEDEHDLRGNETVSIASQPVAEASETLQTVNSDPAGATEEHNIIEVSEADHSGEATVETEDTTIDETIPEVTEPSVVVNDSLAVVMPPPGLPILHTDFAAPVVTGVLTPAGKEPSSPTLKAVDSATLPLLSPFPGEQATSYLDYLPVDRQRAPLDEPATAGDEQEADGDTDYVLENSFFSSIGSSKAGGFHQDHETAFTPVRFAFGMDGAGWSRPLELSSSPREEIQEDDVANDEDSSPAPADNNTVEPETQTTKAVLKRPEFTQEVSHPSLADTVEEAVDVRGALSPTAMPALDDVQSIVRASPSGVSDAGSAPKSTNVILMSSDVESDDNEDKETNKGVIGYEEGQNSGNETVSESEDEDEEQGMVEYDKWQNSDNETVSESEDEDQSMVEQDGGQTPDDEIIPESEDENTTESDEQQLPDDSIEPGADEVQVQQALPRSSQAQEESHVTTSMQTKAEDERSRSQEDDLPLETRTSAAVYEVIDISSPSADESSDINDNGIGAVALEPKQVGVEVEVDPVKDVGAIDELHQEPITTEPAKDLVAETISKDYGDSGNIEAVKGPVTDPAPSNPTHLIREPASAVISDAFEEPQLATSVSPPFIEDYDSHSTQIDPGHADVKVESVEDSSLYVMSQSEAQDAQHPDSASEILISIPENGYKLGEVQYRSVPATAPARNTRSKAKSAVSPPEEDAYISRLSTSMRSTRSRTSVDSMNRTTVSPPRTRTNAKSSAVPTQDATQERSIIVSQSQLPQSPRRSPRTARTTKALAQVSSPAPEEADEDQADRLVTDVIQDSIDHPTLPSEGYLRSSPPAPVGIGITHRMSSPVTGLPVVQQSAIQGSQFITLDDTQQTAMEPPLSFQAGQPDQSLLTTPDLTQTTSASASLRSFDVALPGVQTQPAPRSPSLRTSSRRKPFVTDLSSSPVRQSSDAISADDEDATLISQPDPPSIGLSTPLAYYTPLRDLKYFLNRSSQFHSSSNPDILALCTSSSTVPEQAKKGPRHWNTTLHMTDLSTYPSITTVNVFRAYQNALPVAEAGDIVLLRAFAVESRNREPVLRSVDESSWCVWRYGKPVWGARKGEWGEMKAREEVKGPDVERGEGEWTEVDKLRSWYISKIEAELDKQQEEREHRKRETDESNDAVEVEIKEFDGSHE